jgi:hypothetical protein
MLPVSATRRIVRSLRPLLPAFTLIRFPLHGDTITAPYFVSTSNSFTACLPSLVDSSLAQVTYPCARTSAQSALRLHREQV